MWRYEQISGKMIDPDGDIVAIGYSGNGDGKNNPEMQNVHNVGPIPEGDYFIGTPYDSADHGPYVLPLVPAPGAQLFGRNAFLIHGDNVHKSGTASEGCIIMPPNVRHNIGNSDDHNLTVVSGLQPQQETA